MKPFSKYQDKPMSFWATVKLLSERLGYSVRVKKNEQKHLKRYSHEDIINELRDMDISIDHLLCREIVSYMNYRADVLENEVQNLLMNREEAAEAFFDLKSKLQPQCKLPMNKQKKDKRHYAYLTCIVNMLTESVLGSGMFDDDPRGLTIITQDHKPKRTFSRWMDGAYPNRVNPKAVWEIKEYYGTTTFGSRVADGVYETMLDGYEMRELKENCGIKVQHFLIIDDRFTWWDCGRSYLCRIVDMMHIGLVDEVIFGREVLSRWPKIVSTWDDQ